MSYAVSINKENKKLNPGQEVSNIVEDVEMLLTAQEFIGSASSKGILMDYLIWLILIMLETN